MADSKADLLRQMRERKFSNQKPKPKKIEELKKIAENKPVRKKRGPYKKRKK
jgi:hypothetical protein